MNEKIIFTCIGCPIGCPLQLEHEGNKIIEISGNTCNRGAKYAKQEFKDPKRVFSTTVSIDYAYWNRLPVKITKPISKDLVMEAAKTIHKLKVFAPIKTGDVLMIDLLGNKGINVVSTRTMIKI